MVVRKWRTGNGTQSENEDDKYDDGVDDDDALNAENCMEKDGLPRGVDVRQWQDQAQRLRHDIACMRQKMQRDEEARSLKKRQAVDQWLDRLLFVVESSELESESECVDQIQSTGSVPYRRASDAAAVPSRRTDNDNGSTTAIQTQLLATVPQVYERLIEGRYSTEQVLKMFDRLCETSHVTGRNSVERNPMLQLLLQASGKCDALERMDNPNKRWTGRVEQVLYKKLFAKEWGIDWDEVNNSVNNRDCD